VSVGDGERITPRALLSIAAHAATIRLIGDLKHSIASHLVSANVNLTPGKTAAGHKSIGSAIRYVTMSDQQASKATTSALMKIY
jgi:hypothetical protein